MDFCKASALAADCACVLAALLAALEPISADAITALTVTTKQGGVYASNWLPGADHNDRAIELQEQPPRQDRIRSDSRCVASHLGRLRIHSCEATPCDGSRCGCSESNCSGDP